MGQNALVSFVDICSNIVLRSIILIVLSNNHTSHEKIATKVNQRWQYCSGLMGWENNGQKIGVPLELYCYGSIQ